MSDMRKLNIDGWTLYTEDGFTPDEDCLASLQALIRATKTDCGFTLIGKKGAVAAFDIDWPESFEDMGIFAEEVMTDVRHRPCFEVYTGDDFRSGAIVLMRPDAWQMIPPAKVVMDGDDLNADCARAAGQDILDAADENEIYGFLLPAELGELFAEA